jgi:hypothetical protein
MEVKNCKVKICKSNDNGCCIEESIVLDYFGINAMPTCMSFDKKDIKDIEKDIWDTKNATK